MFTIGIYDKMFNFFLQKLSFIEPNVSGTRIVTEWSFIKFMFHGENVVKVFCSEIMGPFEVKI